MRRSCRNSLGVLCLALLGLAIPADFLLFDQSQSARNRRFDRTVAELQRGNYFAWAQLHLWVDRLTPTEKMTFDRTCVQYALTNRVLHVTGIIWPPERTSPGFRAWSGWLKGGVGMEDRTLAYDIIEFPPSHDLHLNTPEGAFRLPAPDPRTTIPAASEALVNQPAALRAQ
jgi:hypothetical protein